MKNFNELNVNPLILKGIEKMKFEETTEVQEKVIPFALSGKDVIAQAPTGTGKTVAYAIPLLEKIDSTKEKIQAIVVAPTRELVVQITKEINNVGSFLKDIFALAIYGGESIDKQITSLKKRPQIIVATPGRLMDHMERHTIKLNEVTTVVLDEADEMLNMGFREDIDNILVSVTNSHQIMLFSATISKDIESIAKTYLVTPEIVRISRSTLTVPQITQKYIDIKEKDKLEVISRLIDINEYNLVMVFCNTKRMVDEVTSGLLMRGFMVEALHGDMKQMQRDRVMNRFRNGQINILVASDVAARGLDIDDVDVVFNYDVPTDDEYYVHRIGRTGRAKKEGVSITLVTRSEKNRLRLIMNYTKSEIEAMPIPPIEKVIKTRVKRILDQAVDCQKNGNANTDKYLSLIDKELYNLEKADILQLIRGLVFLNMNTNASMNQDVENVIDEIEERKKRRSNNGTRIFISLGKKDNIKVYNLTDMLTKKTNMTNADINAIELRDNFSFFEIPNEFVDELLSISNELEYKGRKILIEVAKAKEGSKAPTKSRSTSRKDTTSKPSMDKKKKVYNSRDKDRGSTRNKEKESEGSRQRRSNKTSNSSNKRDRERFDYKRKNK